MQLLQDAADSMRFAAVLLRHGSNCSYAAQQNCTPLGASAKTRSTNFCVPYIFEWDAKKAAANLHKYGVSFAEATEAFGDPLSLNMPDPNHSRAEERFWSSACPEVNAF
jgi:hypothetical protein